MKIIKPPDLPAEPAHLEALGTMYPSELVLRRGPCTVELRDVDSTVYGCVLDGVAALDYLGHPMALAKDFYFAVPGRADLEIGPSTVVGLVRRAGYLGQFTVGKVEDRGRLRYVDGCSASILVHPPRRGDPVLHHVHFPEGIEQAQGAHPLICLGMVLRGRGEAFGPKCGPMNAPTEWWTEALEPGCAFLLHEQEMHGFRTNPHHKGSSMDVVAFHPASNWGPRDAKEDR